jgi:hypothetical protein
MVASKFERLAEFLRRLGDAEPATSLNEARELIASILKAVEDEMTDIPYDPPAWETDQRLYPPHDDAEREVSGHPCIRRYRSLGHNTYIGANGAIEVRVGAKQVIFAKPGADGKEVWEQ